MLFRSVYFMYVFSNYYKHLYNHNNHWFFLLLHCHYFNCYRVVPLFQSWSYAYFVVQFFYLKFYGWFGAALHWIKLECYIYIFIVKFQTTFNTSCESCWCRFQRSFSFPFSDKFSLQQTNNLINSYSTYHISSRV